MSVKSGGSAGIGFAGAMFLLFLGLKLCGVIAWSWWWVFAPLWVPVALTVAVLVALLVIALVRVG